MGALADHFEGLTEKPKLYTFAFINRDTDTIHIGSERLRNTFVASQDGAAWVQAGEYAARCGTRIYAIKLVSIEFDD